MQQIGREGDSGVKREAQVDAQQKGQQQNLQRLQAEEEISLDPEGPPGIALARVPARCGGKEHEQDMRRRDEGAHQLIAKVEIKGVPAPGECQGDQGGEQTKAQQRDDAQSCSVAERESPLLGAEPERITRESDGEIGDAGERGDMTMLAALVHVPELRLPCA